MSLRDYGTGTWEGGDPECNHEPPEEWIQNNYLKGTAGVSPGTVRAGAKAIWTKNGSCLGCGARRIDHQLGSEQRPDCGQLERVGVDDEGRPLYRKANCAERDWRSACHVCRMVLVFRELRRVLRDDGTLWLNYGDTYSSGGSSIKPGGGVFERGRTDGRPEDGSRQPSADGHNFEIKIEPTRKNSDHRSTVVHKEGYKSPFRGTATTGSPYLEQGKMTGGSSGLPAGNLVGIPWRVALALQADGWILRSDIPWVKRSAMPESATNRPCKALEYVFLLAKKPGYYFDMEAVRKRTGTETDLEEYERLKGLSWFTHDNDAEVGMSQTPSKVQATNPNGRSFRNADLWFESVDGPHGLTGVGDELVGLDITSQGYPGAHFATFSEKLVEPFIKAGTSEHGCCGKCGTPWVRQTKVKQLKWERPNDYVKRTGEAGTGNSCSNSVAGVEVETIGWRPNCECHGKLVKTKEMVLGYGSYHSHEADGVGYGLRQDGGPLSDPGEPTKELEKTVISYVSSIPIAAHPVKPCVVLDPFLGSGTTAAVAVRLGRHAVGIELSAKYLTENAIPRIGESLPKAPAKPLIQKSVRLGGG